METGAIIAEQNWQLIIDSIWENRNVGNYDTRSSAIKTDFLRKWHHDRSRVVYRYLKDHTGREGKCWPGIRTVSAELSLSRSTVKQALDDLCKAELISREHHWRENGSLRSNLYRLL